MSDKIPILDLSDQVESLWAELNGAIQEVLRSGRFILGPNVKKLEEEFADYVGAKYAVGVNSGTDALIISLLAMGIEPGDEVITPSFTFFATPESVTMAGAVPVFADIDPKTFNLDPALIEERITPRTKAILPVHLFGHAADMGEIRALADKHGLMILEDVAQAFGGLYKDRKLGSFGTAAAFSFFPTKNLGAYGDGGMIVTDNAAIADKARMLREHGSKKKYVNEMLGYNSRLDELQAAILRVKLPHVERWNEQRRAVARRYDELLSGLEGLETPHEAPYARHVFHQYTVRIRTADRDRVQESLSQAGVSANVYYQIPCHRAPVYYDPDIKLPRTEEAARTVLSLPIWPEITEAKQRRVAEELSRAVRSNHSR